MGLKEEFIMSELSPSAIRMTPERNERINQCTSQAEIQEVMREFALVDRVVERDWDENILNPTARATRLATILKVGDVTHELVGDNETDLLHQQNEVYRQALANQAASAAAAQPRGEDGRFVAAPQLTDEEQAAVEAAAAAEAVRERVLAGQLATGAISMEDYLSQSHAIERHNQRVEDAQIQDGWAAATAEFIHSDEGANWIGEAGMPRMLSILMDNHLENAPNKLEVLKEAWALMQKEDYEAAVTKAVTDAKSPQEISELLGVGQRRTASGGGFFGR
jgi:hypothetical protein